LILHNTNYIIEMEDQENKIRAMVAAFNEIPRAHRDCLQFLVFHLSRVIQHAKDNLVSLRQMAF
jgi:hypothetical protein